MAKFQLGNPTFGFKFQTAGLSPLEADRHTHTEGGDSILQGDLFLRKALRNWTASSGVVGAMTRCVSKTASKQCTATGSTSGYERDDFGGRLN